VAVVLFLYCNLLHSAFGRAVNTARHDALRAVADGVNVPGVLAAFFAASAAVAGLGGWLYAHEISYLAPESLSTDTALQALLMAIVGGARKPLGPIIGACVLLTIVTYLPAAESQGMVYGGALILILLVAPRGLVNAEWWSTWRRRRQSQRANAGNLAGTITVTARAGECP
jgi:branched-chain amino acid transport system permease protein